MAFNGSKLSFFCLICSVAWFLGVVFVAPEDKGLIINTIMLALHVILFCVQGYLREIKWVKQSWVYPVMRIITSNIHLFLVRMNCEKVKCLVYSIIAYVWTITWLGVVIDLGWEGILGQVADVGSQVSYGFFGKWVDDDFIKKKTVKAIIFYIIFNGVILVAWGIYIFFKEKAKVGQATLPVSNRTSDRSKDEKIAKLEHELSQTRQLLHLERTNVVNSNRSQSLVHDLKQIVSELRATLEFVQTQHQSPPSTPRTPPPFAPPQWYTPPRAFSR